MYADVEESEEKRRMSDSGTMEGEKESIRTFTGILEKGWD